MKDLAITLCYVGFDRDFPSPSFTLFDSGEARHPIFPEDAERNPE
jgi:hypothetical protein